MLRVVLPCTMFFCAGTSNAKKHGFKAEGAIRAVNVNCRYDSYVVVVVVLLCCDDQIMVNDEK